MIIKNNLRPTAIRTNSRFRGPTELTNYTNFILESVHDLKLLGSVMDRNDFIEGHRGHSDFITDNFAAYLNGEGPVTARLQTAATLQHPVGEAMKDVNLMSPSWVTYGECTKTATANGVRLKTTGLLDPAGIQSQLYVEEGDIIYIRMAVKWIAGNASSFSIGSRDINQNDGDVTKFKIPQTGGTIYVDKRLYCKHREPISINIDVHNIPDLLKATTVEISDVEILYLSENQLAMQPVDSVIKSRINQLESNIQNIISNI